MSRVSATLSYLFWGIEAESEQMRASFELNSGNTSVRSDFDERYQSPCCDLREEQELGPTCDRVTKLKTRNGRF
jgi:hypothetical protein